MKGNDSLNIDRIAFFGRTYAEYLSMFGLDETVMKHGRILDCPAGASSFEVPFEFQKGANQLLRLYRI